jgi:hypothetical protein
MWKTSESVVNKTNKKFNFLECTVYSKRFKFNYVPLRMHLFQFCGSGMFIPDPDF